jgi:hypothetical protein
LRSSARAANWRPVAFASPAYLAGFRRFTDI